MSNQSGNIKVIFLIAILALAVVSVYGFRNGYFLKQDQNSSVETKDEPPNITNELELKDYYSDNLKVSFKIPANSQIQEKFTNIEIKNSEGLILVSRNGTNYDTAKAYYSDLKIKNKLSPLQYEEGANGKYDYVLLTDEDPNQIDKRVRSYIVYSNYAVYIFSTSDEVLFPILDRMVKSFEHKS